jgi:hypothetical protein
MDVALLYKEKKFVNHQFPTVTALDDPPTIYEGMLRCEQGRVKELAEKKVWPFTEYVEWHRFRINLPEDYPLKPPVATWLTEIDHPNIVPNIPGAVCVSILGENWRPDLKLVSVINALYYLLADPNPDNVFDHPKCLEAAKICRKYGFPLHKKEEKGSGEELRFNVVPIPGGEACPAAPHSGDVMRFKIIK